MVELDELEADEADADAGIIMLMLSTSCVLYGFSVMCGLIAAAAAAAAAAEFSFPAEFSEAPVALGAVPAAAAAVAADMMKASRPAGMPSAFTSDCSEDVWVCASVYSAVRPAPNM